MIHRAFSPSSSRFKIPFVLTGLFLLGALAPAQDPPKVDPPKPAQAGPLANTAPINKEQKDSVLKGMSDVLMTRAFVPGVDFKKWDEFLEKRKDEIEKADNVAAFGGVINRALRDFGFSHIRLSTPRAAAQRGQTSMVGSGLGVTVGDDGMKVTRVADESPAKTAGLAVGDLIVKIDGKKADKREDLDGDEGRKIALEVKKEDGTTKELTLELKKFSTVRKETLTWMGDDTAVLRVYTFAAGYGRDNIETLMKDAAKAKYLVLDLRSNGGGAVNNLNHLLSLLMPNGTSYGTFISRKMADDFKKEKPDAEVTAEAIYSWTKTRTRTRARSVKPFEGKIAVLVNRGSASASEICAASLREGVGAQIVGQPSMGAVLASVYARLPEGFSLQHPVSDYITDKGVLLEKHPPTPDVAVTGTKGEDGKDPVIEKAVETLKKASK